MKKCSRCQAEKPFDQFNRNRRHKDGRDNYCKECRSAYMKQPRQQERMRDYYRVKVAGTEQRQEVVRRGHFRRRYGITIEQYDQLLEAQGGGCALCGVKENPDGRRLCVDHDHETGAIRGLLCRLCNTALHKFETRSASAERLVEYLK
jgi:hypothetical protein